MTKTYEACFVPDADIRVDGIPNEPAWEAAHLETRFTFPWEDRPVPATEFRALFDEDALYFAFRADDEDIVLAEDYCAKEDNIREDRVELLFSLDGEMRQYFCIEIDPLGRVLDYQASYYRKFDFSWSFPGLEVAGRCTDGGYTVEGMIPHQTFASLGFPALESGCPIRFGIYRAEFRHAEGGSWEESWISWVDPRTPEPDFHVPASMGCLRMQER